ncbi:MAG: Ldh family oxidoreductase [Bacillota bacterium]
MEYVLVSAGALRAACARLLEANGVPQDKAALVADALVDSDLRGVESHGVLRLETYLEHVSVGNIDPRGECLMVSSRGVVMVADGNNGFGQVVGRQAMGTAIEVARQHGASLVLVKNSNHLGSLAYYAGLACEHDMIGIALSNASAVMAPWGGMGNHIGNNPLAVAVPLDGEPAIILDISMSVAARGKIMDLFNKGERIPAGWALGPDGRATTDPGEALAGSLMPFGGHKGSGLAVIVEVLTAVLSGSPFGRELGRVFPVERGKRQSFSHLIGAVAIESFAAVAGFYRHLRQYLDYVKACPVAPGHAEVLLPGELELRTRERRQREGIPVPVEVWRRLEARAARHGFALSPGEM